MALIASNEMAGVETQNKEVREMVLYGLEKAKMGHTKDFNEVCERLEKKYKNAQN